MLFVASCKRGPEHFSTTAIYDAPRSGFRVIVHSSGAVAPNQDLATSTSSVAIVCPTKKVGHPVQLDLSPTNATPRTVSVNDEGKTATLGWDPATRETTMARVLQDAAYPTPDARELAEVGDTIDGVALGPKGTRIAGQTHELVVTSVVFQSKDVPTVSSCSP